MSNPFESSSGTFLVLVNEERQFSLWPSFAPVPDGWELQYGPKERLECMAHIEKSWTDMRPNSLQIEMAR